MKKSIIASILFHLLLTTLIFLHTKLFFPNPEQYNIMQVSLINLPQSEMNKGLVKESVAVLSPKEIKEERAVKDLRLLVPVDRSIKVKKEEIIKEKSADLSNLNDWWSKEIKEIAGKKPVPVEKHPEIQKEIGNPSAQITETIQKDSNQSELASKAEVHAPVAGKASLEINNFRYPFYLKNIENKISGLWMTPLIEGNNFSAIISFIIERSGKVNSVKVERSSGNSYFDQASLRAVYQSSPLPPLPTGLADEDLKIHFNFVWER